MRDVAAECPSFLLNFLVCTMLKFNINGLGYQYAENIAGISK
jgi:hypothetical protein